MWRGLVLVILALGVAGFGVCALCGGVMGVSWLLGSSARDAAMASTPLVLSAIGAAIAGLCWWGFRKVRASGQQPPVGAAETTVQPTKADDE